MNHKTQNPIALQSQQWIIETFIELLNKKTFQDITISEIAAHADLGRRTFYRNFTSKEDVLDSYLDHLIEKFLISLEKESILTPDFCLYQLFTLCNQNKALLFGLYKSHMLSYLLNKWNLILPNLHQMMLDKLPDFPNQNNENALAYTLAFNVGGIWNVISKWIGSGMTESPEELREITMPLLTFGKRS